MREIIFMRVEMRETHATCVRLGRSGTTGKVSNLHLVEPWNKTTDFNDDSMRICAGFAIIYLTE